MQPLVDIAHLDFRYGSQPVLRHVDLHVEAGTTLGLIGPNGGGKTTLVKLLLGLLRPSAGTISVDGLSPAKALGRGDVVGYLPQNPSLPKHFPLDVRQCVRLGLAGKAGLLHGYAREDLAFADALIERVGLASLARAPVGSLSGGTLQRMLIARALAPRPKLLVLDEPTVGIDRAGQQQFIAFLQELKSELSLTVILVSHDLRAVAAISDRIACLNQTLHYHDVPHRIPAELVYRMFSCDLQALGIEGIDPASVGCGGCAAHAEAAQPIRSNP
jgi:zinc transport system ATP-binding protein